MVASRTAFCGLELVGVQEVVVHRPQVADEVCLPGEVDGIWAGNVDHGRRADEVVGGLEGRVALAEDQHLLVDEIGGIDRHLGVVLGQLETLDVRPEGREEARGHDQAVAGEDFAAGRFDPEPAVLRDSLGSHPVADLELEAPGEGLEVLDQHVRGREVLFRVVLEEHAVVVAQQRVPVEPQPDFRIVVAGVDLVAGDQRPVPGKALEEGARGVAGLEDQVVPATLLQVIAKLQAGRAGSEDQVVVVLRVRLAGAHGNLLLRRKQVCRGESGEEGNRFT